MVITCSDCAIHREKACFLEEWAFHMGNFCSLKDSGNQSFISCRSRNKFKGVKYEIDMIKKSE